MIFSVNELKQRNGGKKNERASTNSIRCSIYEVYFIDFMFRLLLCSLDENHGPSFFFFFLFL